MKGITNREICILCNKETSVEHGKSCKMFRMHIEDNYSDFCSEDCFVNYVAVRRI